MVEQTLAVITPSAFRLGRVLKLSYQHNLSDEELVGVVGLSPEAIAEWRSAALQRLALRANMAPLAVEGVLRESEPAKKRVPA